MIPRLYHGVSQILTPDLMGQGPLTPKGVTVHYTAGGSLEGVRNTLLASGNGYHLVIEKDGKVVQLTYLDLRVNHAGKALWNNRSPNRHHIAVALASWGKLSRVASGYMNWIGDKLDPATVELRQGTNSRLIVPWDAATKQQEASLLAILNWCVSFGIDAQNICGHDECAIPLGRKVDPGGVLSFTMEELRQKLTIN